jgi:hypothetical protein
MLPAIAPQDVQGKREARKEPVTGIAASLAPLRSGRLLRGN